jgi:hypothetical protein
MLAGLQEIINYIKEKKFDGLDKDVYEFGVCTGGAAGSILLEFKNHGIKYNRHYGFDSCEGLPEEAPGLYNPKEWHKGAYNIQDITGMDKEKAADHIRSLFTDYNFELIVGFFKDSLTSKLVEKKQFKPALFISMDVDLYISCYQALDFMCENNLIENGTIVRYDDWDAGGEMAGESLANKQICKKYGFEYEILPYPHTKLVIFKKE